MQPSKIAAWCALTLSISISVWIAASRVFDTTCDYNKQVHRYAECVDSVKELLANPEKYDGALVILPGEFGFPLEGSYLKDGFSGTSVWLNIEKLPEFDLNRKCGLTGQIKGVFHFGKSGHFGHWPGNLEVIEFVWIDESSTTNC